MTKKMLWAIVSLIMVLAVVATSCASTAPATPTKAPAAATTAPVPTKAAAAPEAAKPAPAAPAQAPAPAPAAKAEPIKIGGLFSFTGLLAEYGPLYERAAKLKFDEVGWKVAGRPIELIMEDTASDPAPALTKAKKLIEQDKVHLTMGEIHSGVVIALAPYFKEKKNLNIGFAQSQVTSIEWGWRIVPEGSNDSMTYAPAKYAYEVLGARTATTIGSDYVAGYEILGGSKATEQGFAEQFEKLGGKVIQQQWVPPGTPDFSPYLLKMQNADIVVEWFAGPDEMRFMSLFDSSGLKKKMKVMNPHNVSILSSYLKEVGDPYIGALGSGYYNARVDLPENKKFVEGYKAKYGEEPNAINFSAYQAATVALASLEATKGDTNPDKLRSAMLGLKIATASGPVSFDEIGHGNANLYIQEVKKIGGQIVWDPIHTYPEIKIHPKVTLKK